MSGRLQVDPFDYQRSPVGSICGTLGGARANILRRRCRGMAQCNSPAHTTAGKKSPFSEMPCKGSVRRDQPDPGLTRRAHYPDRSQVGELIPPSSTTVIGLERTGPVIGESILDLALRQADLP